VAAAVYDATVVFCDRFIDKRSRTHDQMVQAARSGVRNISEGSGAAATSRKSEMKLTNVARASLSDELLRDYASFLVQNGWPVWPKDSREAKAMRARLAQDQAPVRPQSSPDKVVLTGLFGLTDFVAKAKPELAANAMLCAVNQAAYLLRRQLDSQGRTFLEEGGFTEKLYAARTQARKPTRPADSTSPACPDCGKPMLRRVAKTGVRSGQSFWGCSAFPNCKGPLPISQSPTSPTSPTGLMNP
jgi:restriction system protein